MPLKASFILESVTPLFLGGASQKPDPRPASVRGALRYWFRAGLGGALGDAEEDISHLAFHEKCIFGSTDAGSSIVVRFLPQNTSEASRPLQPHKTNRRESSETAAFTENSTFKLVLSLSPQATRQKDARGKFELVLWSTLLWLTVGGLGRRSRRGGGSLRIRQVEFLPPDLSPALAQCLNLWTTAALNKEQLATKIKTTIDAAIIAFDDLAIASDYQAATFGDPPYISTLKADTRIVIWTPDRAQTNKYATALMPLMNKMSTTKAALRETDFEYAFGGVYLGPNKRRASPLHVTAHRLTNGWALVLTFLRAEILDKKIGLPEEVENLLDSLTPKIEVALSQGGE